MDKKFVGYTNVALRSPGPAQYCIKTTIGKGATDPSIEKNPAYTIRGNKLKDACHIGPGPAYHTARLTRNGKERIPGGVIGILPEKCRKALPTPGPADYCIASARVVGGYKMVKNAPHMGCKPEMPAPNAYLLPGTLSCRGAQLGKRFKPNAKCPLPGPGEYDLPHADLYLPGAFRMGRSMGKQLEASEKCPTPGPADYDGLARADCCPKVCERRVCRTTFGIRRPDHVPTFAVPADNSYDYCYH